MTQPIWTPVTVEHIRDLETQLATAQATIAELGEAVKGWIVREAELLRHIDDLQQQLAHGAGKSLALRKLVVESLEDGPD